MTTMTTSREALSDLFKDCWKDESVLNRMEDNPVSVLAEYGLEIPEGIDIDVVRNTETTINLTLPKAPANIESLSDEELLSAATGSHNFKAIDELVN